MRSTIAQFVWNEWQTKNLNSHDSEFLGWDMYPEITTYRVWFHLLNNSIRSYGTPLQYYDQLYCVNRNGLCYV